MKFCEIFKFLDNVDPQVFEYWPFLLVFDFQVKTLRISMWAFNLTNMDNCKDLSTFTQLIANVFCNQLSTFRMRS